MWWNLSYQLKIWIELKGTKRLTLPWARENASCLAAFEMEHGFFLPFTPTETSTFPDLQAWDSTTGPPVSPAC